MEKISSAREVLKQTKYKNRNKNSKKQIEANLSQEQQQRHGGNKKKEQIKVSLL